LGKTVIQLEVLRLFHEHTGKPALIVCPLGVRQEFSKDAEMLGMQKPRYITNTNEIEDGQWLYLTNYERVRMGSIDPSKIGQASFDEASILRSLSTDTVEALMRNFREIPYRFVFTATPAPNRYLELTNYAEYLGIMDRGQILTRFFQRDSTKAGNLNLHARRAKEFWMWMASWACFITKPSDLGYSDDGYDLPDINIIRHRVTFDRGVIADKRDGQTQMFANAAKSLQHLSKEKRESTDARIAKSIEIVNSDPDNHYLLWHDRNVERDAIVSALPKGDVQFVTGSMSIDQKEDLLIGFSNGEYKYLATKPRIAGSGCNFQGHCHKAIFTTIGYKFNDFIQAVHRIHRFGQPHQCEVHLVYTDAEDDVLSTLESKWEQHKNLQNEMTHIIQNFGLNADLYKSDLSREMFKDRQEFEGENFKAINNDNVAEIVNFKDDSIDMICTSIPFGNHYEYSENYNCFGHNVTNVAFFEQMDHLTPHLLRVLRPGRICAVHVKDRIQYSYQTGAGGYSIDPFSDHTNIHFLKHGFDLVGRITVTTDVVSENNQTYRLGYSEKCKDGTKMGVGLPEYVLLFRKRPSDTSNSYADVKVEHDKKDYSIGRWQIDAHSHWGSDGKRLVSSEMLTRLNGKQIVKAWKDASATEDYDYKKHIAFCDDLETLGKLPRKYMVAPPQTQSEDVWTDITRMRTLNGDQARRNLTKHICPLQLDLIERLIERYTNKSETVLDPFGGIMSVPYQALKMGRKAVGIELNKNYWQDGVNHLKAVEMKAATITLF
jgi:DNA modification methylase